MTTAGRSSKINRTIDVVAIAPASMGIVFGLLVNDNQTSNALNIKPVKIINFLFYFSLSGATPTSVKVGQMCYIG